MIYLVAGNSALFVQSEFDIGERCRGLRGPLQIFAAHPLNANRFSHRLGQDYGVIFRARIAAVGAPVVPCSGMRVNDDLIGRGAEHRGNFAAKGLRILIVRVNVHGAVGFYVCDRHGRAYGRMLHEGKVISSREFLVRRGERRRYITLCGAAFGNLRGGPVAIFAERIVELFVTRQAFPFRVLPSPLQTGSVLRDGPRSQTARVCTPFREFP